MMTINEAIVHAEWAANNCEGECAEEHKQLAEWLRELVTLRKAVAIREAIHEYEELKDEHAKLRKLLQEAVNLQLEDCGDCWGGLCEECECWVANSEGELRALGIEVR